MFATKTIVALCLAAGVAIAAPTATTGTRTTRDTPTAPLPVDSEVVTHRVVLGFTGGQNPNGLNFEPNNVAAKAGEIVEFKFLPANHSVAESSFAKPCEPLKDNAGTEIGIFSGFHFATSNGQLAPNVFQIEITDEKKPIWLYCPQTKGDHCQKGMSMVINQNVDSGNTLVKYQANSALTGTSVVPATIQGGTEGPNPNPNAGFP